MDTARDVLLICRSELSASLRNRIGIIIGLVQPFVYLVLFGPLMIRVLPTVGSTPKAHNWQIYVGGLVVQLGLFTTGYAGFNLIPDLRAGVIERMRVTPVSRVALLLGRVLRDAAMLFIQAVLIVVVAVLMGLRA